MFARGVGGGAAGAGERINEIQESGMTREDLIQQMEGALPSGVRLDDEAAVAVWLVGAGYRARDIEARLDDVIARARKLRAPRIIIVDTLAALVAGSSQASAAESSCASGGDFALLSSFVVAFGAIAFLSVVGVCLFQALSPERRDDWLHPPF